MGLNREKIFLTEITLRPDVQLKFSTPLWYIMLRFSACGHYITIAECMDGKDAKAGDAKVRSCFYAIIHCVQAEVIRLPRKGEKLEPVTGSAGFFRRPGQNVSFRIRQAHSLQEEAKAMSLLSLGGSEATGSQSACTCHSSGRCMSMPRSQPASGLKSQSQ